jgi:hypothetical protein
MRRKNRFTPPSLDRLEGRLVLSHTKSSGVPSVIVSGLFPHMNVLNRRQQPVIGQVNQAFDSFQADYDQARATYFASLSGQTVGDVTTMNAFALYTQQRVSLLAQQLISSALQYPQGTARGHGQMSPLKQLISTKIYNQSPMALPASVTAQMPQTQILAAEQPAGSLAQSLLQTIPPPGTSAATASLYSLSQDNAIDAARVAVINGVTILKSGYFGVPTKTNSHTN